MLYKDDGEFDIVRTNKTLIMVGIISLGLSYTPLCNPILYALTIACMLVSIILTAVIYLK